MIDREQVVKKLYPWHDRQGTSGGKRTLTLTWLTRNKWWKKNCNLDMTDKEQVVENELYHWHDRQGTSGEKRTVSLT